MFVQSIVSLTKFLVENLLIVFIKSIAVIFFAEKLWEAFALAPYIFSAKNNSVFTYYLKI